MEKLLFFTAYVGLLFGILGTLTFQGWWIAAALTLVMVGFMFRPIRDPWSIAAGLDVLARILWLIPIFGLWAIYFACAYFMQK